MRVITDSPSSSRGLQRTRFGQGLGDMQFRQQAADRDRPLHFRSQRGRREPVGVVVGWLRRDQRQPAFAELAQRFDQRLRIVDQHAFDQLPERALDRVLPTGLHLQPFADARRRIQPALLQPRNGRALFLAERRVLQGFQRRQPAAAGLRLLAHFGQLGLRGALLVLQLQHGLLARIEIGVEAVERGFLRIVLRLHGSEGLGQRCKVESFAFARQLFAAAFGIERLAIEIVDARALDVAGARGLGLRGTVRVPALLPVGQRWLRHRAARPAARRRRPAVAPAAVRHPRSSRAARPGATRRR